MGQQAKTPATPVRWALLAVAAMVGVAVVVWMQRDQEPISSAAYDFAIAIEASSGRRDTARIERLGQMLSENPDLSPDERQALQQVLAPAKAEDWQAARRAARELMQAQVRTARAPAP